MSQSPLSFDRVSVSPWMRVNGVQAAKAGNTAEAAALWQRLAAVLPADSPDLLLVRRAIEAVQRR